MDSCFIQLGSVVVIAYAVHATALAMFVVNFNATT